MVSKSIQRLSWGVAGRRGMEIHGFAGSDLSNPVVRVRCYPLHWDFGFDGVKGSGRVRIGGGCDYNPLQMIEALWTHLAHDLDPNEAMARLDDRGGPTAIIEFDPDATLDLGSDWE